MANIWHGVAAGPRPASLACREPKQTCNHRIAPISAQRSTRPSFGQGCIPCWTCLRRGRTGAALPQGSDCLAAAELTRALSQRDQRLCAPAPFLAHHQAPKRPPLHCSAPPRGPCLLVVATEKAVHRLCQTDRRQAAYRRHIDIPLCLKRILCASHFLMLIDCSCTHIPPCPCTAWLVPICTATTGLLRYIPKHIYANIFTLTWAHSYA